MSHKNSKQEFNELATGFIQGRMTRRHFIHRATQLGLSAALVSRLVPASFGAGDDFIDSSSIASNESPITRARIEYLQSKPYKNTTINVMVIRSAVGDCVEYHAPRWEEETGLTSMLPRFRSTFSTTRFLWISKDQPKRWA